MSDVYNDIDTLKNKSDTLKNNKVARFSYTTVAYDTDNMQGVTLYEYSNEQNIPAASKTDLADTVLDKGIRSQSASLPRNAINHFFGRVSYNLNKLTDWFNTLTQSLLRMHAQNGHRYSSTTKYRQYDWCTVIDESNTQRYFMRSSSIPEELVNVPPLVNGDVNGVHWTEILSMPDFDKRYGSPYFRNGLLIPLYVYPTDAYTNTVYNNVINLKRQFREIPFIVILNPADGPGTTVDNNYTLAISMLRAVGIQVVGYVDTNYTAIAQSTVRHNIKQWKTLYPFIDGIYFNGVSDGSTNIQDEQTYYRNLVNYCTELKLYVTVGNPGKDVDSSWYSIFNILIEHTGALFPTNPQGTSTNIKQFYKRGCLKFACASDITTELTNIRTCLQYYGWVYFTTDAAASPWDSFDLTYQVNVCSLINEKSQVILPFTVVQRDANGRAKVAAPSAADDIARKDTVDAVQTNLTNHINATTGIHGATSAATANTLVIRDASGRAKVAAPSAADDIARKDTVDNRIIYRTYYGNATFADLNVGQLAITVWTFSSNSLTFPSTGTYVIIRSNNGSVVTDVIRIINGGSITYTNSSQSPAVLYVLRIS